MPSRISLESYSPALCNATTPAADRGNSLLGPPESMYRKPPSGFCDCFT